jgi:hypothetical protein
MSTHRVYLTHTYRKPADLIGMNQDQLAAAVYVTPHDMSGSEGWTEVGQADVTITLHSMSEITANTIATLRAELQTVRAEAQMKASDIEDRIAKLLAITCDEVA